MYLLVVEDESRMAALLQKGLSEEGYTVSVAADGYAGLDAGRSAGIDLILLDVMLPGMDGFAVARRLRADGVKTPILMLTARDATPDIVRGLDLGADDYLTKPFSFEVLLARIRVLLRRHAPMNPNAGLRVGDLWLDPATHRVLRGADEISLTRTEFLLLETLLRRPGQVIPRSSLIESVWGFGRDIESNTLDAFIRLLRAKIEPHGGPKRIRTVRGVGYCIEEEASE